MHVRVCRDCGEEYRPEIAVCADCGGVLEDRYGDATSTALPSPASPSTAEPPPDLSGHRELFLTYQATEVVPLAEALRAAGVPFVVHERAAENYRRPAAYSVLVPDEEGERALRVVAPLLAHGEE